MSPRLAKFRTLLLIIVVIQIYIIYFLCVYKNISEEEPFKVTAAKYILYWSPFWKQKDYYLGYGFEPFKKCEYNNCFATDNRTLIPLEKFDALMFHASLYHRNKYGNPWIRFPHQMYIYVNMEAPTNLVPKLKPYKSYFNWTMSYRFDSDIIRRHGYIVNGKTNYSTPSKELIKNKSRIAAWFVSHCQTASKREELTKKIQAYMSVDVYGKCGEMQCQRKKGSFLSPDECYDMIEKKYKFYFSFENSYCIDYSTEKLYNILRRNIVPVVYGAGDYKLSAPPHSVINVADFESAKELTDYLKYLDENPEEYLKYFEWKKMYKIVNWEGPTACQICKKLHEPIKHSVYHNLHKWWWGENVKMCKVGRSLPKIVRS